MKQFFIQVLALFAFAQFAVAQETDMMAKSGDKGLYLEHKVVPKQSFFAIGRLYNVNPKALASYNKLDISKGLVIGQVVRIPLTDTNFTQKSNKGMPVYYTVVEKDGLLKISNMYKDVSIESLRKWNGLPDNNISVGARLIVGFLTSGEITKQPVTPAVVKEETVSAKPKEDKVASPNSQMMQVTPEAVTVKPVVNDEPQKETPKIEESRKEDVPKEEPKKSEAVITEPTKVSPQFAREEVKPASTSDQGYFKYYFDQQVKAHPLTKESTVTAGTFKTTSGWVDAKYYMLIDGVQPGTIVKIINPSNNKNIFAKVLGEMSSMKINDGLNIRISSAAASALQVAEQDKFILKVSY